MSGFRPSGLNSLPLTIYRIPNGGFYDRIGGVEALLGWSKALGAALAHHRAGEVVFD
jgi:hypothetical protein